MAAPAMHREATSAGWDYAAAFVDPGTVIAVLKTRGADKVREHWLIDTDRGPLGPVAYPAGSADRMTALVGLGDGTWATLDADDHLSLWQVPLTGAAQG